MAFGIFRNISLCAAVAYIAHKLSLVIDVNFQIRTFIMLKVTILIINIIKFSRQKLISTMVS